MSEQSVTVPAIASPRYADFDIGNFDAEYAGQTIKLLQNPSRGFRESFASATLNASVGNEPQTWLAHVVVVINAADAAGAESALNALPVEVMHWLFLWTLEWDEKAGTFSTNIPPHVYSLWDDYRKERVKARAARGNS